MSPRRGRHHVQRSGGEFAVGIFHFRHSTIRLHGHGCRSKVGHSTVRVRLEVCAFEGGLHRDAGMHHKLRSHGSSELASDIAFRRKPAGQRGRALAPFYRTPGLPITERSSNRPGLLAHRILRRGRYSSEGAGTKVSGARTRAEAGELGRSVGLRFWGGTPR